MKSINQCRILNDIELTQAHQQRRTTDAIKAFQVDQFLVAERISMFADFAEKMLPGHQERPREKSRCPFLVLFGEAVGIDQAVSQFVRQGQPPTLQ